MAIKMGIVGCGGISHAHGPAAQPLGDKVKIVACCDVVIDHAKEWAAKYGATNVYPSLEEMLDAETLDGVLLATWPNQHREQIETCLSRGIKNILSEKSLTVTGKEAVEIWDLVEASDAFLMEAFMYRHHPAVRKLQDFISEGKIGEVDRVNAHFNAFDPELVSGTDENRNWRQRAECAGGIPYDFACYAINACGNFCTGVPQRVCGSGTISEKYNVVNRLFGIIEYSSGKTGIVESTKKSDCSQELTVSGSKGILRLPVSWTIGDYIELEEYHSYDGWVMSQKITHPVGRFDSYQLQLENFADVVSTGASPTMPLAQSVMNTFVIESLIISLKEKRSVDIDIPDRIVKAYQQYLASIA